VKFDPEKHHRRSVRLKRYDYTGNNAYFVTICTYQKECLFGTISNGRMNLNVMGEYVRKTWLETAEKRINIKLNDFVIMPNHFHGILWLMRRDTPPFGDKSCRDPEFRPGNSKWAQHAVPLHGCSSLNPNCAPTYEQFGKPVQSSLPTIIRSFKSAASKIINENRLIPGTMVWQRNYYEHIIRSHEELRQTIEYIRSNPGHWTDDKENPANF